MLLIVAIASVTAIVRIRILRTRRCITIWFIALWLWRVSIVSTTVPLGLIRLSQKKKIQVVISLSSLKVERFEKLTEREKTGNRRTCLLGLRPHERRMLCPPNCVPFSIESACSADALEHDRDNNEVCPTRIKRVSIQGE